MFDYSSEPNESTNTILMLGIVEGGAFATLMLWGKTRRIAFSTTALRNWFELKLHQLGEEMSTEDYQRGLKEFKERGKY